MSCSPTKQILKAADFVVRVAQKREASWVSRASQICKTLSALQPCFPLYADFTRSTDPGDLKKVHVFMNEEAKAKLGKFYLCSAYQLRRAEVDKAGSDNTKLLSLIEDTAQKTVEPFLEDVRGFIADYNSEVHKALEETSVYQTIDKRLFLHHNFLVAAPEAYAEYLARYDQVYIDKPAGSDVSEPLVHDQELVEKAQTVYNSWVEISGTPLKGQIKNALIDSGFIFGERGYESPPKIYPTEANI